MKKSKVRCKKYGKKKKKVRVRQGRRKRSKTRKEGMKKTVIKY